MNPRKPRPTSANAACQMQEGTDEPERQRPQAQASTGPTRQNSPFQLSSQLPDKSPLPIRPNTSSLPPAPPPARADFSNSRAGQRSGLTTGPRTSHQSLDPSKASPDPYLSDNLPPRSLLGGTSTQRTSPPHAPALSRSQGRYNVRRPSQPLHGSSSPPNPPTVDCEKRPLANRSPCRRAAPCPNFAEQPHTQLPQGSPC